MDDTDDTDNTNELGDVWFNEADRNYSDALIDAVANLDFGGEEPAPFYVATQLAFLAGLYFLDAGMSHEDAKKETMEILEITYANKNDYLDVEPPNDTIH